MPLTNPFNFCNKKILHSVGPQSGSTARNSFQCFPHPGNQTHLPHKTSVPPPFGFRSSPGKSVLEEAGVSSIPACPGAPTETFSFLARGLQLRNSAASCCDSVKRESQTPIQANCGPFRFFIASNQHPKVHPGTREPSEYVLKGHGHHVNTLGQMHYYASVVAAISEKV